MKNCLFLSVIFFLSITFLNAQEKTISLGVSSAYDIFEKGQFYYSSNKKEKGFFWGLEYSENSKYLGYRLGLSYVRLKDQTSFDFNTPDDFFLIDILIIPDSSTLQILDFPITGQVYLPLGSPKIRIYANMGLMTSLTFFKDNGWFYYADEEKGPKSLSIRAIYGLGLSYQFAKHFGIDFSVNKKRTLHTLNDDYRRPHNSLSFQTTFNYIF